MAEFRSSPHCKTAHFVQERIVIVPSTRNLEALNSSSSSILSGYSAIYPIITKDRPHLCNSTSVVEWWLWRWFFNTLILQNHSSSKGWLWIWHINDFTQWKAPIIKHFTTCSCSCERGRHCSWSPLYDNKCYWYLLSAVWGTYVNLETFVGIRLVVKSLVLVARFCRRTSETFTIPKLLVK